MTTTRPNLDYAPPPPTRKRRAVRRAAAVVLVAVGAVLGLRFGPVAWRAAQTQYWQRACLRYEPPAGQTVCEEPAAWAGSMRPFVSAAPKPPPLAGLEAAVGFTTTPARGPVLYLHERRTPGGRRRLVVVRRVPPISRQSWDVPVGLDVELWEPLGWFVRGNKTTMAYHPDPLPRTFDARDDVPALTIYAGRSDPDDPARFTIEFVTPDHKPGVLEGTLRDPTAPGTDPGVEWRVR